MDKNSQIGELLEKGQSTATNVVGDTANLVKSQVLGDEKKPQATQSANPQIQSEPSLQQEQESIDRTKEVVGDFYAFSERGGQQNPVANPSDEQRLAQIRQQLQGEKLSHQQLHEEVYYNPLFAYEKGKAGQEERPAEYAQKEKQLDLEKDSEAQVKKDQDIATQRAQRHIEIKPGAG